MTEELVKYLRESKKARKGILELSEEVVKTPKKKLPNIHQNRTPEPKLPGILSVKKKLQGCINDSLWLSKRNVFPLEVKVEGLGRNSRKRAKSLHRPAFSFKSNLVGTLPKLQQVYGAVIKKRNLRKYL